MKLAWLFSALAVSAPHGWCADPAVLTLAVAASSVPVVEELVATYKGQSTTPVTIRLSSGSTGLLAQQLRQGAPFDLFLSADLAHVEDLAAEGFVTSNSVAVYAEGSLVLWTPPGKQQILDVEQLGRPLPQGFRIAIANPETAPYGTASVEAMRAAHVWEKVQPRVVYGESVSQAFQFAKTGNVDCAFLPGSLVLNVPGASQKIPQAYYRPIRHALGVVQRSKSRVAAEELRTYLVHPDRRELYAKHGYRAGN